jgi:dienelactone hydrolase
MRVLIAMVLCLVTGLSWSADYAREKKWADEITPGIVVGEPVYLTQKNGHQFLAIYTEAKDARLGVIVVHGLGIHPDWGLVGTLRTRLADDGYTTLSIQMPVLANTAKTEDYNGTLPEAAERLQLAADYLKSKSYKKIAVVSHSMGSRMSNYYLGKHPDPDIVAWAALGMPGPASYSKMKFPILDLYGQNDMPIVLKKAKFRAESLKGHAGSKQEVIPNTDHFYANHEDEMVKAVKDFLDSIK